MRDIYCQVSNVFSHKKIARSKTSYNLSKNASIASFTQKRLKSLNRADPPVAMDGDEDEYLYIPSTSAQTAISLLVIPSSLLSFLGSSLIIYHVLKDTKRTACKSCSAFCFLFSHSQALTPYLDAIAQTDRRLLLALSVCDIISTLAFVMSPYLTNSGAIQAFVWSFGNASSCSGMCSVMQQANPYFAVGSHLLTKLRSSLQCLVLSLNFLYRLSSIVGKSREWVLHQCRALCCGQRPNESPSHLQLSFLLFPIYRSIWDARDDIRKENWENHALCCSCICPWYINDGIGDWNVLSSSCRAW